MKLFSLVFLVGLLSVQGFPAGEIGASHGITVDVFISTMLSSFSAVKGKDNCEGVISAFQSVLEAWKGKEAFITDSFLAAFKTALAVKKVKHILIFHHAIDAFKTVLEVGAVKKILISEGFLLAFKGALEAKKAVVSEVFLKAFETALWPGGKFLGNPSINGLKSSISIDVFVKAMVSAFGAKDGVVTESFIKTITVTFGKCKGVHAGFIPAWKKAFDTCKGTQATVSVAAFTLALKKESGLSFIPSDCLKALKSPENVNAFPKGVHDKILSALFNGIKPDCPQSTPTSGTPGDIIDDSEELPTNLDPTPASSAGNSDNTPVDASDASTPDKFGSTIASDSNGTSSDSNTIAPLDTDAPTPDNTDSTTPDSDSTPSKTATGPGSDEPGSPTLESSGSDEPATKKSGSTSGQKSGSTATATASSAADIASGGISKASSVAKSAASGKGSKTLAASESKSKATASGASSTAASAAVATAGSDASAAADAASSTYTSNTVDKNPTDSKPCDKDSLIPTPAKLIDVKNSVIAAGAGEIAAIIPGL